MLEGIPSGKDRTVVVQCAVLSGSPRREDLLVSAEPNDDVFPVVLTRGINVAFSVKLDQSSEERGVFHLVGRRDSLLVEIINGLLVSVCPALQGVVRPQKVMDLSDRPLLLLFCVSPFGALLFNNIRWCGRLSFREEPGQEAFNVCRRIVIGAHNL